MADDNDDDKTEEPTEKRLADAIERGNTPISREIAFLTSLARLSHRSKFIVLPGATPALVAAIAHFIDDPSGWRLETAGDATLLIRAVAAIVGAFRGPAVLLLMAFGVGGSVLQNRAAHRRHSASRRTSSASRRSPALRACSGRAAGRSSARRR